MTISPETRASLRRLDRELSECLDLLESSDDPAERYEMASRRADRDQAAGKVIIPLLDALEAAEAALQRCLNYIENTESELGIKLDCGDAARAALGEQP